MKNLALFIRLVVRDMPGAFSHRKRLYQILDNNINCIDSELMEFYNTVYEDLEMSKPYNDKQNMGKDFSLFRTDFKKAVKQYKDEKLHVQAEQAY